MKYYAKNQNYRQNVFEAVLQNAPGAMMLSCIYSIITDQLAWRIVRILPYFYEIGFCFCRVITKNNFMQYDGIVSSTTTKFVQKPGCKLELELEKIRLLCRS